MQRVLVILRIENCWNLAFLVCFVRLLSGLSSAHLWDRTRPLPLFTIHLPPRLRFVEGIAGLGNPVARCSVLGETTRIFSITSDDHLTPANE